MARKPTLAEKRDELRKQMEGHHSLPEYILDSMGALLQWLVNPSRAKARKTFLPTNISIQENEDFPSPWLNGIAIAILTFLIGWVVAVAGGRPFTPEELKLTFWAVVTGALALIANKVNIRAFLNTFHNSCVNRMLRLRDMEDLGIWLVDNFKWWKPLLTGLVIGPLLGWFLYNNWLANHPSAVFHAGPFIIIVFSCVQAVWVGYYLPPFYVIFPSRLNRYHFDLYRPDPSKSEVVERFSRLLNFILYVTIGYIVWLTIGLAFTDVLTAETPIPGLIFSLFVWAPTVLMYATGQFHLSDLIRRAKWKMLNDVQTKIESLYDQQKIPDKETLDRLVRLMDYHDRIKDTPDSALNFRASLNFLNSLLLPILAFAIGNLREVIDLFR